MYTLLLLPNIEDHSYNTDPAEIASCVLSSCKFIHAEGVAAIEDDLQSRFNIEIIDDAYTIKDVIRTLDKNMREFEVRGYYDRNKNKEYVVNRYKLFKERHHNSAYDIDFFPKSASETKSPLPHKELLKIFDIEYKKAMQKFKEKDYFGSLHAFKDAIAIKLQLTSGNQNDHYIAACCYNIGSIYLLTKNYKQAQKLLSKSLDILTVLGVSNEPRAVKYIRKLISAYINDAKYKKAIPHLKTILANKLNDEEKHKYTDMLRQCVAYVNDDRPKGVLNPYGVFTSQPLKAREVTLYKSGMTKTKTKNGRLLSKKRYPTYTYIMKKAALEKIEAAQEDAINAKIAGQGLRVSRTVMCFPAPIRAAVDNNITLGKFGFLATGKDPYGYSDLTLEELKQTPLPKELRESDPVRANEYLELIGPATDITYVPDDESGETNRIVHGAGKRSL